MNKRIFFLSFVAVLLSAAAKAASADTIHAEQFGILPYTYENQTVKMQEALRACKEQGAKVLAFRPGRYDFWSEGAVRKKFFVSNTSSEEECPSKVKTIGIYLEDLADLTIEGNGATLMFHGKMTMIALHHCSHITLRNFHTDFERPGGSELTYQSVEPNAVTVKFHRDSRYEVADGRIHLFGEGWRSNRNHCIEYNPHNHRFFYSGGWNTLASSKAREVSPGVVCFTTPEKFLPQVGNTLTVRDIIRDQVGMLIHESRDVRLEDLGVHYMHGLGIVSQYTRNVTMQRVQCRPNEESGRILASSADFMHFSGCSGSVRVLNCFFAGAQDDPINVHGTNLRAIEQKGPQTLTLRFMHPQSYGFNAYSPGDTVAFVRASRMERFATARVESVRRLTDRTLEVSFDRPVPQDLEMNHDCVENMTCTPEVEIRGNYFTRTSARGTLMTTPRKVVIADNTYYKTGMSAILIEGDAEGWYESGAVNDVLIENNSFIECAFNGGPAGAVIALNPSNRIVDANRPVHRNVRIIGNRFRSFGNPLLFAKSTQGLTFRNNTVTYSPEVKNQPKLFLLNGCKDVCIEKNQFPAPLDKEQTQTSNMP